MVNAYLDIETTSLSPKDGEIVTIQYQRLDFETREPIGDLIILKAWESSEKDILEKFQKVFGTEQWSFVAHGYNLHFENKFLYQRSLVCGLENPIKLFDRPTIDLHPIGILMVGGFKGSGLDKITGKEEDGLYCLNCYDSKEYNKVEVYIKQEAKEFIKLLVWLTANMPKVLDEFRESLI